MNNDKKKDKKIGIFMIGHAGVGKSLMTNFLLDHEFEMTDYDSATDVLDKSMPYSPLCPSVGYPENTTTEILTFDKKIEDGVSMEIVDCPEWSENNDDLNNLSKTMILSKLEEYKEQKVVIIMISYYELKHSGYYDNKNCYNIALFYKNVKKNLPEAKVIFVLNTFGESRYKNWTIWHKFFDEIIAQLKQKEKDYLSVSNELFELQNAKKHLENLKLSNAEIRAQLKKNEINDIVYYNEFTMYLKNIQDKYDKLYDPSDLINMFNGILEANTLIFDNPRDKSCKKFILETVLNSDSKIDLK